MSSIGFFEDDDDEPGGEQQTLITGYGQLNVVDEIEQTVSTELARELAAEWIGLPMFGDTQLPPRVTFSFESELAREEFLDVLNVKTIQKKTGSVWSVRWPPRPKEDMNSLRFETSTQGEY